MVAASSRMAAYNTTCYWALFATAALIFVGFRYHEAVLANGELAGRIGDLESRRAQLDDEVAQLQRNVELLKHDRGDLKSRLEAKSTSLGRCERAESECKAALATAASGKTAAEESVRTCEESRDGQREMVSQKMKALAESASLTDALQRQLANLRDEMNTTLLKMQGTEADAKKLSQQLQACEAVTAAANVVGASTVAATTQQSTTMALPTSLPVSPSQPLVFATVEVAPANQPDELGETTPATVEVAPANQPNELGETTQPATVEVAPANQSVELGETTQPDGLADAVN